VSFEDLKNPMAKTVNLQMNAPFEEADASKPLMRKTSKIIAKGKYKLVTDGPKQPPMHK